MQYKPARSRLAARNGGLTKFPCPSATHLPTGDVRVRVSTIALQGEYDFDGGYFEMRGEADRLRPLIRETLVEELIDNPEMSAEKIRECIEDLIDDGL